MQPSVNGVVFHVPYADFPVAIQQVPSTMAKHECYSGAERCSRDFRWRIRRPTSLGHVVVRVGFRLHVAFTSTGWAHSCFWRVSHLSDDTIPVANNGASLRSPKGPPDERAWDAGCLHAAPIIASRACNRCGPACVVLSRVHDHSRGALPSVRVHVRNVAICGIVRGPRRQRSSHWHVPAAASQPRCLAHIGRPADLCLCWPKYGDTHSFPQHVSPHTPLQVTTVDAEFRLAHHQPSESLYLAG